MVIRRLTRSDAEAYVALRREMLDDAPWAFAASPESDVALDAAALGARLAELDSGPGAQAIVGAFAAGGGGGAGERLVGAAGLMRNRHPKMAHRAGVWGVYVRPEARGRGVGRRIMAAALEVAGGWPGVTSVGLSVSEGSAAARRVYESLGFRAWGVEPGALVLDGRAYDEVYMVVALAPSPAAGGPSLGGGAGRS